ncbi:PhnD/SsuA/transferrin family substrate-binding protein [Halomonas llamarensis]|uniref:histidine kinase n=1 Tax=Halomonas llamarensis TaxID=2945104 RepID=A0ABT0SUE2_9GAMM|nr:PhnD/SsuA/transferrin family substrate-binding protein [Halomonas llamarensis]MCL7931198.1 PhnD/SsuA/transferrin family substrate-binding protein [Halomonas llamarensis]
MPLPARLRLLIRWLLVATLILSQAAVAAPSTTLGVFAYRDAETVRKQFTPVIEAMQYALPGNEIRLEVLSLKALDDALEASAIDFILTNPRHFLAVRQQYDVSGALATLKTYQGGRILSSLAGVILAPADANIDTLEMLERRTIGIPGKRFLGGFLAQAYEIHQQGYVPERFADYQALGSHDAVIQALLNGEVDAGFVRSGILEDWIARGRLAPDTLDIIPAHALDPHFPLAHSTRLYPEWALAAMPHVPMEDIRRVSNALLHLDGVIPNGRHWVGFDPPQDYLSVELAARALGVAPFATTSQPLWQQLTARFGHAIWIPIALAMAFVLLLALFVGLYVRKSRLFERFIALFYYSPSATLLLRPNGQGRFVIAESNHAAHALFKAQSSDDLLGKKMVELSPDTQPDGQPSAIRAAEWLARADHERQRFIWQHTDLEGASVLVEVTLIKFTHNTLMGALGQKSTLLVALHDITEQERARLALEEERNALQNILWGTAAGTWEWNVQTGETRINERWAEMVGYRLDELTPITIDTWMSFCHPDDLKRSEVLLTEHFEGKRDTYELEARMRHRDGHWIWVQDRGRVITRTEFGEPLWVAGTHSDITSRKEAEVRAQSAMEQTRKHAALLPGMLYQFWHHPDGRSVFPYASAGIQDIYGVSPEDVQEDASAAFDVIAPEDVAAVASSIYASATDLSTWRQTYRINHPDGHQLWVEGIATPERLKDGSTMWHGYLRNVTDEHTTQLQLEQYRESLERSNNELEHFAYAASHDLRQPLRMVTSYAQLLERHLGGLDEDGEMMLHYLRDGAKRMDDMLLSLLGYSRVGRKGQPMQDMPLKNALEEALHFLTPDIAQTHAAIKMTGEWPTVHASPDEMTRLFQNLISNALKYRSDDDTAVEITVHSEALTDRQQWQISVTDNGIGIAPDQIERLFKVFQRLHTREQYEGTGVGLAVCRKIVERHGGQIWVESDGEGKGSCFTLTLPMTLTTEGET